MHVNEPNCQSCLEKLSQCCPAIQTFYHFVKSKHYDVHIAWGFRDEASQRLAFQTGKSKLNWPYSKHNNMIDGKPFSWAIDLFRLSDDGKALFETDFYQKIYEEVVVSGYDNVIFWGGNFPHFKDYDHYEVN